MSEHDAENEPQESGCRETERQKVVLATTNAKKLVELRAALEAAALPVDVLGLSDVEPYEAPAETEQSFEGNALVKARECALRTGLPALADDSGIEVDVLNGCPGVRSARWAGPACDDEANNDLLLAQVDDVPADQRQARFVCAIAIVVPDGKGGMSRAETVRREWPGMLATERHGSNGFGYDPLFIPDDAPEVDGRRLSSAELEPEHKNRISHRGQAIEAITPMVAGLLGLKMPEEGVGRPESNGQDAPDEGQED